MLLPFLEDVRFFQDGAVPKLTSNVSMAVSMVLAGCAV
jgi:hypothetical protein